jgi:MYXO-CTERM domain-containing protein
MRVVLLLVLTLLAGSARAQRLELDAGRAITRVLPRGALLRIPQTVAGIPVHGAAYVLRVDDTGRVRWIGRHVVALPELDLVPTIARPPGAELVVFAAAPGDVELAWRQTTTADAQLRVHRRFIDAHTGRLLRRETVSHTARPAMVYLANPAKTPTLTEVDLGGAGNTLDSPDLTVSACIDDASCQTLDTPVGQVDMRFCGLTQRALADGDESFTAIVRPADDRSVDDAFAEVQMYWHVSAMYAFFRGLGFADLTQRPLSAQVNFLFPDASDLLGQVCSGGAPPATSHLVPFDNAAFLPAGGLFGYPAEDSIIFGQGTSIDFSYDGDVIAHELTHAVMGTLCPELPMWTLDERGLDPTSGGMHEGTADFFSSAFMGDPDVGEYTGPALGVPGALRSLTNTKHCPEDLWGEAHQDGEAWGGLLWDIRSALPEADHPSYDRAVLTVIAGLGADSDQPSTGAALAAELDLDLGASARDLALARLAARGLDDCNDRVVAAADRDTIMLVGVDEAGLDLVPGPVQLELANPAPASGVLVHLGQVGPADVVGSIVGSAPMIKAVVKAGAPITWHYDGGAVTHDGTDVILALHDDGSADGTVATVLPAGPVYVQLASIGAGAAVHDLHLDLDPTPPPPTAADAGCGCTVGVSSPPPGLAIIFLALAFALLLRQRRRGRRLPASDTRGERAQRS